MHVCNAHCLTALTGHTSCCLQKNTEFGYSRKDIILIGAGLIGFGFALYYGLQVLPSSLHAIRRCHTPKHVHLRCSAWLPAPPCCTGHTRRPCEAVR